MRLRRRLSLAVAALAVGGIVGVASLLLWHFDVFERAELPTIDARFAVREDPDKAKDVVIVGVDAQTLSDLQARPPIRRLYHARLLDRLREMRPRAIAYDFQFTEPSDRPDDDERLAQAVLDTSPTVPIVLATVNVLPGGRTLIFGDDEHREAVGGLAGNATVIADPDGIFRRVWYSEQGLESFAVVTAEQALKRGLTGPAYPAKGEWVDFAGGPNTIKQVSFSRVLDGRVPASAIRGKVVVVGATDPTFQDVHPVATSGRFPMSGPELQANAIQSLMRGSPLKEPAGIVSAAWIVLWSLIGALGPLPVQSTRGHWLRPALFGAAITFGLLAALVVGLALTFKAGWIMPATYSVFGFVASAFTASSLALARTRSEVVRNRFSRFVPEQAVDAVMAMSGQKRLEPAEIEATVMFIDMRGFSTHTEHRTARETIETLNQYLTIMSEGLLAHGATVVSYMGDGIMAVFGAPLAQDDHADRAVEAARELVGPHLEAFNAWLGGRTADWVAVIGVGIHSGPVASGMVGSERRLEYAAVGDTTNTAARLESATKELRVPVLLSDATRALLARADERLVEVATIAVKGREQQVRVWTLPETAPATPAAEPVQRGAGS
jgi:adenylate cyclase